MCFCLFLYTSKIKASRWNRQDWPKRQSWCPVVCQHNRESAYKQPCLVSSSAWIKEVSNKKDTDYLLLLFKSWSSHFLLLLWYFLSFKMPLLSVPGLPLRCCFQMSIQTTCHGTLKLPFRKIFTHLNKVSDRWLEYHIVSRWPRSEKFVATQDCGAFWIICRETIKSSAIG